MTWTPYFAPTYFAPTYFPGGGSATGVTTSPVGSSSFYTRDYFSASYFAPGYFTGQLPAGSSAGGTVGSTPYFSPSYFAPSYFPPSYFPCPEMVVEGVDQTEPPAYRDAMAYGAIVGALLATGEFAEVATVFGSLGKAPLTADRTPTAVVSPAGWHEDDEVDSVYIVRRVSCRISLIVRQSEDIEAFEQLDRLSMLVQSTLDGSDLGGCMPTLTRFLDGRPDSDATYPESRYILDYEFSYLKIKRSP